MLHRCHASLVSAMRAPPVRPNLPENIVRFNELEADPDRVVAPMVDTGAVVLLSHRGAPVTVLQSLSN
jgi:hypothetical protein